ncbi:Gfo/Idh/MocA family protein [Terriglobus aquaticus]|uniref:Gfo/Idh/MocA family protein n=1 Tax=Terriglobus aquaticus TaxID=940139 RepID=A0ABW9KKW9_9BACT|nr:Gfo/Idh/MocA family oxidoreductase [Terriglobus aquaticus]
MNRRTFLQTSAATAAMFARDGHATMSARSANDRVQMGVIGPGSRGKEVLRQMLHVPGVEVVGVADVYEPRFAQADAVAERTVFHTKDYRELIARPDVDAFLIATPLSLHREHLEAVLHTGKPVYSEKAMGFTVPDCQGIIAAARRSRSILQIGHQYRYAPWIVASMERIRKGEIGEPTHVYAYWHRNNDWRRPVPKDDPNGKLEHLINWRLYRETSGGLVTELGVHHIDLANWIFGGQPTHVLGTNSIVRYRDGRTVGDNTQCTFLYAGGKRMVFSSLTDNAKQGNEFWVYGTEGSVQFTIEDAVFYYEKKKPLPKEANATVVEHGVETGASYSTGNEMPYRGPGDKVQVTYIDPTLACASAFFAAVRGGAKPLANAEVGYRAAIACAVAHDAVFTEEKTPIPALPVV